MIIRAKAPLRISFAGGGTDISPYPETYGGVALNATINKYAYVSLIPGRGETITVHSLDYDTVVKYNVSEGLYLNVNGQTDLVKAAARRLGIRRGFDLFMHTDAPPGSGLGSSSTVVVALIGAFARWLREPMNEYEVARLAYEIERVDLGIKGGYQDQYAASFGGFNYMEFGKGTAVVNPLRIRREIMEELQYHLVLCYTGGIRLSARIIEGQIQSYLRRDRRVLSSLHRLKAITTRMKNALLQGRLIDFGYLLHEAWELKKSLSDKITNQGIDDLYNAAREHGAIGGKILGAGGGGYLLVFVPFNRRHIVARAMQSLGGQIVDFAFESAGAMSWEAMNYLEDTGNGRSNGIEDFALVAGMGGAVR